MIIKNGKEISAIYKDGREIVEKYRGDRLVYSSGTPVESTFMERTTADGMPIKDASKAKALSVKGNTWVKNQLAPYLSGDSWVQYSPSCASVEFSDGKCTVTILQEKSDYNQVLYLKTDSRPKQIVKHKYLYIYDVNGTAIGNYSSGYAWTGNGYITPNVSKRIAVIFTSSQSSLEQSQRFYAGLYKLAVGESYTVENPMLFDLTQWFGSGNEPITALEFANRLGYSSVEDIPYMPYNSGEVVGVNHQCLPPARKVSVEQIFPKLPRTFNFAGSSGTSLSATVDEDDVITINGVCPYYCNLTQVQNTMMMQLLQGHKYCLQCEVLNNPDNISLKFGAHNGKYTNLSTGIDYTKSFAYLCQCKNETANNGWGWSGTSGVVVTFNDVKVRFSFVDLTAIFGEGNEPTTVEDFYRLCPWAKEYQPYGTQERYIGFGMERKTHFVGKVNWNQVVKNGDFSGTTGWRAFNSTNSRVEIVNGMLVHTILTAGSGSYPHGASSNSTVGSTFPAKGTKVFLTYKVNPSKTVKMGCDVCNTVQAKSIECPQNTWTRCDFLLSAAGSSNSIHIIPRQATSVGDIFYYKDVNAFDLTQMFGEGNEPTTVEEFYLRCPFAKEYQPYNAGEEKMIGKTALLPINTANFPYGMHGINGVQDEHTPKVDTRWFGVVDLGSLGWVEEPGNHQFHSRTKPTNGTDGMKEWSVNMVCVKYPDVDSSWYSTSKSICRLRGINKNGYIYLIDDSYAGDKAGLVASLQGVDLYYELATPIVTPCDDQMQFEAYNQGTETLIGSDAPVTLKAKYRKK